MATGPTKFQIKQARKQGRKYDIKPSDLLDLMQFESAFEPGAVSSAGAEGVTQFIPGTAKAYDVKYGTSKKAQKTQIRGAAHYLSDLGYGKSEASVRKALAGYYGAASPYADQLISQSKFEKYDKRLKQAIASKAGISQGGTQQPGLKTRTSTSRRKQLTQAPISMKAERQAALLDFIQTEDKGFEDYLGITQSLQSLQDVPAQYKTLVNKREQLVPGQVSKDGKGKKIEPSAEVKGKVSAVALGKLAQQMGLSVGEHPKFGGVDPVHATNSFHYSGRAIDVSGDVAKMRAFAKRVAKLYGSKVAELFWNGPGATNIDNGQKVPKGFVDGHTDHVHVAV